MQFFNDRIDKTTIETLQSIIESQFQRVPYTEAVDILQASGKEFEFPVEWGTDLQSEHERFLTEDHFKSPVILFDYPKTIKPFYMYVNDDGQVVALRLGQWKGVFLENRGEGFGVWREPFVELRVPLLFNLRRDPFEKAQHSSNTYNDWFIDRVFVLVPMQQYVAQFLQTFAEYPPSQKPGSFNLRKVIDQIQAANKGS